MVGLVFADNCVTNSASHQLYSYHTCYRISATDLIRRYINQSIRNIALTAIGFHLIWGAIFGYIMTSLLRIRAFKIDHNKVDSELNKIMNIKHCIKRSYSTSNKEYKRYQN